MSLKLRHYQEEGAAFLANHDAGFLFDEPGLGKTPQAIRACDLVEARDVLVLCPASLLLNWDREFRKFQQRDRPVTVVKSAAQLPLKIRGVVVVSYGLAPKLNGILDDVSFDVLIPDECHYLKSGGAGRTLGVYGPKCDSVGGLAEMADQVFDLSGTPAPNHSAELWPALRALAPETIDPHLEYRQFLDRYTTWHNGEYGIRVTGCRNTKELRQRIAPVVLRRRKEDVLKELPSITYAEVPVLAPRLPKEFREIEREVRPYVEAGLRAGNFSALGEAANDSVARLRRWVGLIKMGPVARLVADELDDNKRKVVVFAQHRDVLTWLAERLRRFGVAMVHGGVPVEKRQAAVDAFQTDPQTRVFIGQIQAAGVGLTLTASSDVIFAESSWVPSDNQQAAQRVHRFGQTEACLARFAVLAGSIDEIVMATVARKSADISELLDGEREKALAFRPE